MAASRLATAERVERTTSGLIVKKRGGGEGGGSKRGEPVDKEQREEGVAGRLFGVNWVEKAEGKESISGVDFGDKGNDGS